MTHPTPGFVQVKLDASAQPALVVSQTGPADPARPMLDRVQDVIQRLRPMVQSDGGDIELVEVTDAGIARIRMHGACVGCPSSSMTLKMGVEQNLRRKVPEIVGVEQVT